ncbi:MAG: condensation domain-containing protein, partial [Bacteroidota bacterium]|nr:condensation domain-containing protein [Bacteroidota bacterium]
MAGEPIPVHVQQELDTERIEVRNLYGPTEDTTYSTVYKLRKDQPILIGKPIANTAIYIVNKENQLVPVGVAGEICIAGSGLARGYLEQPVLTSQKFVRNPFSKEEGATLYLTGDLGRWLPNGNIEYLGRIDNQVKLRGYRIEIGEIETTLNELDIVKNNCVIVKKDATGSVSKLVNYFVPREEVLKIKENELYKSRVSTWSEVYETEYSATEDDESIDPEFNIVGWKDSFTGEAIPESQMREWLEDITHFILSQQPQNVLEIGSGTGLIFYQLAGKINKYIGTDFSRSSLGQIKNRISRGLRNYGETAFKVAAAHEVALDENEKVDTVIINSVAQYFPGEGYMTDVIGKCISLLKGQGKIVIGDIRDNRLLQSFKGRLAISKFQHSVNVKEFNWAVQQDVLKEEELCFSPEYFYRLQSIYPQITHVDIQWKHASYQNELSLYRYNVLVYVSITAETIIPEWQKWQQGDQHNIIDQLQQGIATIAVKDIPNPRLSKERLLNKALDDKTVTTVGDIISVIEKQDSGSELVNQLFAKAEEEGYHYKLFVDEDPFKVNVLFEKSRSNNFIEQPYTTKGQIADTRLTNTPLFNDISLLLQKEIKTLLLQRLPDYMVPAEFMALNQLPLTVNGKVDRLFLSQRQDKGLVNKLNYQAPFTKAEKILANIWQELLGIERVGVHDDFFEMGGHSLLAMRVISAIRKELEVELAIKDLFIYSTITDLAAHLHNLTKGVLLPSVQVQTRPEHIPLSFSQERLWFIDKLEGSVQYNIPSVLRLKGKLNKAALVYALRTVVNRHEVLRTIFLEEEGESYQRVKNTDEWLMAELDGSAYKNDAEGLRQFVQKLIKKPFDLSKDDMLRAALITIGEQEYVLVLTVHHIASDGWSTSILVKEVVELYSAFEDGRQPQLPVLHLQYADYAIWQRRFLEGEVMDKKMAYWRSKLEDVPPLQLPADY